MHPFESAIPPFLILSGPSDRMVPQQSQPGRIPMEVKGYDAVGHINMVPGEPIARDDTLSIESRQRWIGQIDTSKDVASAMAEEYAVWEQPPTLRISFGSGFELIHTKTIPDTTRKRSSLRPQISRSVMLRCTAIKGGACRAAPALPAFASLLGRALPSVR